tara:strand:- start:334 stop:987 length:654 start_codon:yes stop_codon:yes gene_type:complete
MNKYARAELIINKLETLYPNPEVPLFHKNNFTLLIAVILSAQSTDKKVNELTKELFSVASNAEDMINLGQIKIYSMIRQLGLSKQKSKNIYMTSQLILEKYKGEVPIGFKELEALPGVGHKTASVVMAQAFKIPAFPVDTHIHRLAQRWGLTNGLNVKTTERDLKRLFPQKLWNKLHLQIIFYGREYCTAKGCDGTKCDICNELYPKRTKSFIHRKA